MSDEAKERAAPEPATGRGRGPLQPGRPGPAWSERRASPRRTALDPRGWIGWWAEGDFHEAEARLLDLGEGGVAIEVDYPPPRDCPLFFSLDDPSVNESVEAEVVAIAPGRKRRHLVRLAFVDRCPSRLSAAILGPMPSSRADPAPAAPSPPAGEPGPPPEGAGGLCP
jgi:hypothetical protein